MASGVNGMLKLQNVQKKSIAALVVKTLFMNALDLLVSNLYSATLIIEYIS